LFVANGLHVPPIAYKLRSLSDLPGLIIQVAKTPTWSTRIGIRIGIGRVYIRILESDPIGACPYRLFSIYDDDDDAYFSEEIFHFTAIPRINPPIAQISRLDSNSLQHTKTTHAQSYRKTN